MQNIVDMETFEEMLRYLEETQMEPVTESDGIPSKIAEALEELKPIVLIGQINERSDDGVMRVSAIVTTMQEDMLLRYIELVGAAPIPQDGLVVYDQMKKEFDMMLEAVEKQKQKMKAVLEEKGYPVFMGVIS